MSRMTSTSFTKACFPVSPRLLFSEAIPRSEILLFVSDDINDMSVELTINHEVSIDTLIEQITMISENFDDLKQARRQFGYCWSLCDPPSNKDRFLGLKSLSHHLSLIKSASSD